jgi:hypothetical protein
MSGSPKYSTVRANAARRERLERERREREARRQAEQARRAALALANRQRAARQRLTELTSQCVALRDQPGVAPASVDRLLAAARGLEAEISQATTDDRLAAASKRLADLTTERNAVAADRSRRLTADARARLDLLWRGLREPREQDARRFDRDGHDEARRALDRLEAALRAGDLAAFTARFDQAASRVESHLRQVWTALAEHEERVRAVAARTDELAARRDGLAADARAAGIDQRDLDIALDALALIRSEIAGDRPEAAADLARALTRRLETIERTLDDAIDRLVLRREMLTSVVEMLPGLGFAVVPGSLTETADGSIALHANRRTGDGLTVVVQDDTEQEHRISYLRPTPGAGALTAAGCTSLVALAGELSGSLGRNGFETGELTWDDDPDQPPRPGRAQQAVAEDRPRARGRVGERDR